MIEKGKVLSVHIGSTVCDVEVLFCDYDGVAGWKDMYDVHLVCYCASYDRLMFIKYTASLAPSMSPLNEELFDEMHWDTRKRWMGTLKEFEQVRLKA